MKNVLIIENSSLFREYLRLKFEDNGVEVCTVYTPMEASGKMRSLAPDLIILNNLSDPQAYMRLLKQKKSDPNTANTPVVIITYSIEQKMLLDLVPYNVKKVFTKPIKVDAFFSVVSEILNLPFSIDKSPGIVEIRVNDNIIFVEITQGLNRDKLEILRFKIKELMDLYRIRIPKIIVMIKDINLSMADTPTLIKLFDSVFQSANLQPNNVCVLTSIELVREFLSGNKDYSYIKVFSDLKNAMEALVPKSDKDESPEDNKEIPKDRVISNDPRKGKEEMLLVFEAEAKDKHSDFIDAVMPNLRIAVIDDDFVTQEFIQNIFKKTGAIVNTFFDGEEFLIAVDTWDFDLAFLDINMPNVNGFQVLKALQARDIRYPVIVLSSINQQEAIIKAIQMGVKSYLVKPLKPEDIFYKSIEILKANF
ncbi:MAG: response regulator [Treponema sp.]|nr:response regulator [Treponema sp.]